MFKLKKNLYNYEKQWYVKGVANKKVSAVFTFKYPVDIKYFSYATYNGGSVGAYKGWNLYYKDTNNNCNPKSKLI